MRPGKFSPWLAATICATATSAAVVVPNPSKSLQTYHAATGDSGMSPTPAARVDSAISQAIGRDESVIIDTASISAAAASVASVLLSSASIQEYAKPTQQVKQVLAIGDSYTAGVGSNGGPDKIGSSQSCNRFQKAWPIQLAALNDWSSFNAGQKPELNFGACTGATIADVVKRQIDNGETWKDEKYHAFGKPQLAVMTLSGNDVNFGHLIDSCIYKVTAAAEDCQTAIDKTKRRMAEGELFTDLIDVLSRVVIKGQRAGGANPSNSFQLYISEYVHLFNDDDPGCDTISWGFYYQNIPLKTELRKQLNGLVDQLNTVIKSAVAGLSNIGVFYVDGIDQNYNHHRLCEPASQESLKKQIGSDTWFWTWDSPYLNGGEGPSGSSTDGAEEPDEMILHALIPDHVDDVKKGAKPWNFSSAFNDWDSLIDALENATSPSDGADSNTIPIPKPPWMVRPFHPKGTAYGHHADAYLAAIRGNRGSTVASVASAAPPSATNTVPPDECGTWYQFFRDGFTIRGKDSAWDNAKLNRATGQGLLDNLRGCGIVSNWQFTNTSKDPNYEWEATGLLPIGTKSCVGDAVLGAGGKTKDGCTGPG